VNRLAGRHCCCGWSAPPAKSFEPRPDLIVIGEPQLREESDGLRFSSELQIRHPRLELRETYWFWFPRFCEPFVAPHIDPFVVGLLPDGFRAAQRRIRRWRTVDTVPGMFH
jgi:hypothetical protein